MAKQSSSILVGFTLLLSAPAYATGEPPSSKALPDFIEYTLTFKQEVTSTGFIFIDKFMTSFMPVDGKSTPASFALPRDQYAQIEGCTRDNRTAGKGSCRAEVSAELTLEGGEPHLLIYDVRNLEVVGGS
jgi:hypothetical protein